MTHTLIAELPKPCVPATQALACNQISLLSWSSPFGWLKLGWRDLTANPIASMFYGLPFWSMALVLDAVIFFEPEYAMGAIAACLILGPFVTMGLYDFSRRREQGLAPQFMGSLTCWKQHLGSMGLMTGVLLILTLLWSRASLIVIALFFDTIMPSDFDVMEAAMNADNWAFVLAYAAVGGAFAALVFSITVMSLPMILDRDTDAITAAITSISVIGKNTAVMILWGCLIATMVGLAAYLPMAVGLAVIGPLLGHASWHAYRRTALWQ